MNKDFSFSGPDFLSYLSTVSGTTGSFNTMKGYLGSLYNQFLEPEGLTYIFKNINSIFTVEDKQYIIDRLKEVSDFVYFVIEHPTVVTYKPKVAEFQKYNSSGLKHYISFLDGSTPQLKKTTIFWKNVWKNAFTASRKKFIFDGTNSLFQYSTKGCSLVSENYTDRTTHERILIEHAIRNSFFFDFKTCEIENRHNDIISIYLGNISNVKDCSLIKNGIPFRDSSRKKKADWYPVEEAPGEKVYLLPDYNGNKEVCDLIKRITGYSLSSESSDFVNFTISHIWRLAPDARFFTNLWNIVLVPSWVNFLLDKEHGQGSLSSKMLDTYKKICIEHYKMSKLNWNFPIPIYPINNSYNNAVSGKYEFNVINGKDGTSSYGRIKVGKVTIP